MSTPKALVVGDDSALAHGGSSLSAAARLLGISRPTLYGLLDSHCIGPRRLAPDALAALVLAGQDTE